MVTMTISLVRKRCQKPRLSEVVPAPLRIPSLVSSVAWWSWWSLVESVPGPRWCPEIYLMESS